MNPALPIVLFVTVGAALLWRRDPRWEPVALACLVAVALLLPTLVRPSAVPSPAAQLVDHAPWKDPDAGGPRNDELRDVTYQVQPWLLYLRSELRQGRLPLWNPHQQAGTPYWANGSSAPLFPLHLLFVLLPLQLGFVLLPWLRVVTAVWGTWLLAGELSIGRSGRALAAVTFGLAGMPVAFLLYPMGSAIALVPWVLWASERLAARRSSWMPLAVAAGLQFLAGHPGTSLHTALLSGLYLVVRSGRSDWVRWRDAAIGWIVGGFLGMVHLLPFAALAPTTSRWLQWGSAERTVDLSVVLPQTARLVLPNAFGASWEGTWFGPFTPMALSLYVGIISLLLAIAGAAAARLDTRARAVVVVAIFSIVAALNLPGVRQTIELLPVVGRAPPHRLVFGFQLGAALCAGWGLERWRRRGTLSRWPLAAVLVGLAATWLGLYAKWDELGLLPTQVGRTALALGVMAALVLAGRSARLRGALSPAVVLLTAVDLLVAHGRINPPLDVGRVFPVTPAVAELAGRPERLAGVGGTYHPNAAMVHGLYDLRGDDSVKLDRYERTYAAAFDAGHPTYFVGIRRWNEEALDRFAVRWVMGPPGSPAHGEGWTLTYDGSDARIWERPHAEPMVRFIDAGKAANQGAENSVQVVGRDPGRWRLALRAEEPATLEIAEIWCEGWRASADGRPIQVRDGGPFLHVSVPRGARSVEIQYRAPGLLVGGLLSAAALALLLGVELRSTLRSSSGKFG